MYVMYIFILVCKRLETTSIGGKEKYVKSRHIFGVNRRDQRWLSASGHTCSGHSTSDNAKKTC